jgi:hypothetical protein
LITSRQNLDGLLELLFSGPAGCDTACFDVHAGDYGGGGWTLADHAKIYSAVSRAGQRVVRGGGRWDWGWERKHH